MHHGRTTLSTALSGLALAALIGAVSLVPSTGAQAQPDVATVQKQVDTLFAEAEQASERVNDAKLQLADLRRELRTLQADETRQDATVDAVRQQVQDSIVNQYTGDNLSAIGQVVGSDDATSFASDLSALSVYNQAQSDLYGSYTTELKALDIRSEATADRAHELDVERAAMEAEKAEVDDKLARAKSLLADLQADERAALLSRGSVAVPSDVPASGRAAAAISYAMAQVGDAYVYGAAGESAFDCSGLTMRAWAQAGISLPHSSSAQYASGTHVAESDLRPGDLVFYYSPISHVGMYIGNGLIVNALNPGAGVRVSELHSMPYAGAVRPG